MAAKKPGRAGSQEANETTEAPTADTGTDGASAAIGGTGARAKGARKTASAGAGSGTTEGEGTGGGGAQSRGRVAGKTAASDTEGQAAAGGSTPARKTGAKSATKSAAKSATKRAGSTQGGGAQQGGGTQKGGAQQGGGAQQQGAGAGGDLQGNLRAFLDHHPHGWSHNDWEGLLNHLRQSGVDTSDAGRIGSELEKERVVRTLENSGVSGLAGNKARSIADQFGTVYELRQASVDDIAGVKGITRSQAEKIHEAVR